MADTKTLEAVQKALEASKSRNFKQSVDIAINLKNIDLNISKNRIDEEVILPHGKGSESKIAIFATGQLALNAKPHVDLLISTEDIEDFSDDKKAFKKVVEQHDFFVAEAPLMPTIGKTLGVVLGPRGKMPRPVPPQIDVSGIVENLRKTVRVRSKASMTFHVKVGMEDMDPKDLATNIDAVIKRVVSRLERGQMNIGSVYVNTTMGPSVRLM